MCFFAFFRAKIWPAAAGTGELARDLRDQTRGPPQMLSGHGTSSWQVSTAGLPPSIPGPSLIRVTDVTMECPVAAVESTSLSVLCCARLSKAPSKAAKGPNLNSG